MFLIDSLSLSLGLVVSLMSVATFFGGMLAYYRSSVKKEYASERDMNHLKNNQLQLSQNIEQLWRLMDDKFDDLLIEIKRIQK